MKNVFEYLDNLSIPYQKFEHKAVFTCDESIEIDFNIEFGDNKNLFLTNRKGTANYLVTIASDKRLDLNKMAEILNEKRLRFGSPDRLKKYLDLTPGSVSPFGLINDSGKEVQYFIDSDLLTYENIGFHPNINTQTVILKTGDFKSYLDVIRETYQILDL